METLTEILTEIEATAADATTRHVHQIQVGQAVRQGDVYLVRVPDTHPHGATLAGRQLAIGTTRGSRHVAEAPAQVFAGTTAPQGLVNPLLGPCVVVPEGERAIVTHPEHAHVSLPAGVYQVTHQLNPRTQQRVSD